MNDKTSHMWVKPRDDRVWEKLEREYGLSRKDKKFFVPRVEKDIEKVPLRQPGGGIFQRKESRFSPRFVRDIPTHPPDEEMTYGLVLQKVITHGPRRQVSTIKEGNCTVLFSMSDFKPTPPPL